MIRKVFVFALAALASAAEEAPSVKLWKPSGRKVHDPHKKFCGATWCYDVLEVSSDADESTIKKSYRKLAREWHPDKNPEKGARAKFQKIAKAYEVLSTDGERAKYDRMMKFPDEYNKEYGVFYFKMAPPESNVIVVVLLVLVIFSGIHWSILKQRKNEYNTKAVKTCVENRGPLQGGSAESLRVHKAAKERFDPKGSLKDKALKSSDGFRAAVEAVLTEEGMMLPEPTVWDTVGAQLPIVLPKFLLFHGSWFLRHTVQGQPYSEDEKIYLLSRSVAEWDELTEKQKADLMAREAWEQKNLDAWRSSKKK